jgi:hypothetical protein
MVEVIWMPRSLPGWASRPISARTWSARAPRGVLVEVGQQQDELVAADPARQVLVAQPPGQDAPDAAQHGVAGGVAHGVVDRLEVIEVHGDEGQAAADGAGPVDEVGQLGVEAASVVQPGQAVGAGGLLLLAEPFAVKSRCRDGLLQRGVSAGAGRR